MDLNKTINSPDFIKNPLTDLIPVNIRQNGEKLYEKNINFTNSTVYPLFSSIF